MKKQLISAFIGSSLMMGTATAEMTLLEQANQRFEAIPSVLPTLKNNAITHEKVALGKQLFFDPRLSASGLISCNTCHNIGMGGDDNLETSIGHGWQKGPRNSPTVFNAVFNIAQFWDGRAADLKEQAKGPVQAGIEMAATPEHVETTLNSIPEYVASFERAFPNERDSANFDNMAKAIEAFEATLITPASPFDQFLQGNVNAMSTEQQQGLALFIDKGCSNCHNGVNIGGNGYFPFGVFEQPSDEVRPVGDRGRFNVTKRESDEYTFRAPPLRNVALTAPYFHSGAVWRLEEAVAIMGNSQLGLKLSDGEVKLITTFLGSLTGQQPRIEYPIMPASTDKTPKPSAMITGSGAH